VPDPTASLLALPADRAARRLALALLEAWDRARSRLDDPADAEALHDFRVALRRLRTLIRAFRPACPDLVPRRLRRQSRRLAAASGESRDLEVQLAWLRGRLGQLTARQRPEVKWMISRLERRKATADRQVRVRVEKRYPILHEQLWAALASEEGPAPLSASAVVHEALGGWTEDLGYRLGRIHALTDDAEAHAARILIKRLRYLIEPFQTELPAAPSAITRLKQLQDLLGDLHDLHRVAVELRSAFRDAAGWHAEHTYRELLPWAEPEAGSDQPKPPGASGGLAALARLLRTEGELLFGRLRSEWLDVGAAAALCADLRAMQASAVPHPTPGIEIERKYLLSGLPPHALDSRSEAIEQGWLPGTELVERLRHVQSADGDAWYRTVKSGQGIQRIEIEERTTQPLFDALWPLTEQCRVRKRRYLVTNGTATWVVDQFLDRDLVLAEIELPAPETPVEIPEWLKEYLVREVTTEPEYVNRALAR
jgi:CHAD domain-containing protein/CYTH domain-containing protein